MLLQATTNTYYLSSTDYPEDPDERGLAVDFTVKARPKHRLGETSVSIILPAV